MPVLVVGIGAGLGGIARYAIGLLPNPTAPFPILTFFINLAACLIIGFIVGLAGQTGNVPKWIVTFIKTGFCGGFSTFSSFSLDAVDLFKGAHMWLGVLYIAASIAFGLAGVFFGEWVGKKIGAAFAL